MAVQSVVLYANGEKDQAVEVLAEALRWPNRAATSASFWTKVP